MGSERPSSLAAMRAEAPWLLAAWARMRDSSTRLPAVSVCAMLLGMLVPSGLAYDLDPSTQAHNHACILWVDAATAGNNDTTKAIEVAPGRRLCRAHPAGRGPTAELAPVLDAELNSLCRGTHDYEVATRPADANVFWHRQNFNALPLPLMTWLGAARPGVVPEGICRVNAMDGSGNGWRLGVLYGAGRNYAKCQLYDGELIEGNYDLVGAYNRSAPYLPVRCCAPVRCGSASACYSHATGFGQVLGPKGAARPRNDTLTRIRELLDRHITPEDSAVFESITGTPLHQLRHALMAAPNVTVDRFLSADRWLHSELNAQGLHMLRCTLAERVVNERRRTLGVTVHPDYADFMRDGFLIKDFSRFDNNDQLENLISMVSGYAVRCAALSDSRSSDSLSVHSLSLSPSLPPTRTPALSLSVCVRALARVCVRVCVCDCVSASELDVPYLIASARGPSSSRLDAPVSDCASRR